MTRSKSDKPAWKIAMAHNRVKVMPSKTHGVESSRTKRRKANQSLRMELR